MALPIVILTSSLLGGRPFAFTASASQPGAQRLVYQTNFAHGRIGWRSTAAGWTAVNGQLLYDGGVSNIYAPYKIPKGVYNFAVYAEIKVITVGDCGTSWGVMYRRTRAAGGYINQNCNNDTQYLFTASKSSDFDMDSSWHSYLIKVHGNDLRLLYDGQLAVHTTSNTALKQRKVGLFAGAKDGEVQIAVRVFKVFLLR